jgi:hypothetical protein
MTTIATSVNIIFLGILSSDSPYMDLDIVLQTVTSLFFKNLSLKKLFPKAAFNDFKQQMVRKMGNTQVGVAALLVF